MRGLNKKELMTIKYVQVVSLSFDATDGFNNGLAHAVNCKTA